MGSIPINFLLEYAYRLYGPDDRRKSLFVDKSKYLLDIYAKAVTGQRDWGVRSRDSNSYRKNRNPSRFPLPYG